MLWFPAVQEVTDVRLSMVLTRNMYVLWDRTRYFEDWRIHWPCDYSLYCFLPVQNVSRPRRWVKWQVDKMVVILEAAVPSQLLYAGMGMKPKSLTAPKRARRCSYSWLTNLNSFHIYLRQMLEKQLNCIHVNTHTLQWRTYYQSASQAS